MIGRARCKSTSSAFNSSHAGLASLLEGEHRVRVSTISSGASLRPLDSWSAYCTAKAGLDMWARCLAHEGAGDNISAISVAPGIVDTGMQADIRSANDDDFPLKSTFVDYHANGDLTNPMDVAEQLLPLLTEHSRWNNQVNALTCAMCEISMLFAPIVISPNLDRTDEGPSCQAPTELKFEP